MPSPALALTLAELTDLANRFRDERDWRQFHNPRDAAISLTLEAAEVLELMQWKPEPGLAETLRQAPTDLADELSDVLYWVLVLAADHGIDLNSAFRDKLLKNAAKYPIDKAKGKAKKYTEI